ncbi:NAD(P)-binding domain-containing protein [Streptomyces sp. NPDC000609]|uniref:NAD(P)-binding domain-containing protein n=1 Tax=Streptomyces sp. NPDC000609 TaxID=3160957 RepID=UPI00339B077A
MRRLRRIAGDGGVPLPRGARTAAELSERYEGVRVCADNQEVVDRSELVIIAVRRQDRHEALAGLEVADDRTVINVMASVANDELRRILATDAALVRAIPLPSVRDRRSVTVTFPSHPVADALFERLGGAQPLADEAAFDVFSALTGTLTTHYAYLAALTSWAVGQGHPRRPRRPLRPRPLPGRRPHPGRWDPPPGPTGRRPRDPERQQRTHPHHMVHPGQLRSPHQGPRRPPRPPEAARGEGLSIRVRTKKPRAVGPGLLHCNPADRFVDSPAGRFALREERSSTLARRCSMPVSC